MSEPTTRGDQLVDAVVLAGRRNEGEFRQVSDAPNEALVLINGRTMLSYVLDALLGAQSIDRIVVCGTPEVRDVLPAGVDYCAAGEELLENLERGVAALDGTRPVAIVTSDIPLITPAIIDGFLAECQAVPADIHYPAIPRDAAEAAFPGVKRTYVKLTEGTYTGGNVFLVRPEIVPPTASRIKTLVDARKSPAKMAALLGPGFVVKLAMGALSARELEAKVSKMFGVRGAVVVTRYAEIGVDVDKLSDLELAGRVLAK